MVINPLGLRHYNLLENCNINENLKELIEQEVEYNSLLSICATEEYSVNWLYSALRSQSNCNNRKYLLEIAIDEGCHYRLYYDLIRDLFYDRNVSKDYENIKQKIVSNNYVNFFQTNSFETTMYHQFSSEAWIFCEIKIHYLKTTNDRYKKTIKRILSDESKHLSFAKKIELNFTQSQKKQFKRFSILRMNKIFNSKIGFMNYQEYTHAFKKYNLDIDDFIKTMALSLRAKEWIKYSIKELYKIDVNLKLTDLEFDNYLKYHNLDKKYYTSL